MINNMKKIIRLSLALLALGFVSCEKELPSQVEQPYDTEISAISIVNAGADGTTVMEGRIDEENKMIDFKRIVPETDFSKLQVKATLSDGAVLENDVFDFSMDEETTEKTLVLRIKNHNRYKDYFIRVRKKVPVFGADWEQAKTYGFCASTNNTYEHFNSASTRWASFDGEYVLVVSRKGGTNPHLLKVSDLKEGEDQSFDAEQSGRDRRNVRSLWRSRDQWSHLCQQPFRWRQVVSVEDLLLRDT